MSLVVEICHLIDQLISKGTDVTFCWVPSHCGLYHNDRADIAAKHGSKNQIGVTEVTIPLSIHECYSLVTDTAWKIFKRNHPELNNLYLPFKVLDVNNLVISQSRNIFYSRKVLALMTRWKLNAFKTKYKNNISCLCGQQINPQHILTCQMVRQFVHVLEQHKMSDIVKDHTLTYNFFKTLLNSPLSFSL